MIKKLEVNDKVGIYIDNKLYSVLTITKTNGPNYAFCNEPPIILCRNYDTENKTISILNSKPAPNVSIILYEGLEEMTHTKNKEHDKA